MKFNTAETLGVLPHLWVCDLCQGQDQLKLTDPLLYLEAASLGVSELSSLASKLVCSTQESRSNPRQNKGWAIRDRNLGGNRKSSELTELGHS